MSSGSGTSWTARAACADLLFGENGEVLPESIDRFFVDAGHVLSPEDRKMCMTCPVRLRCLDHSYNGYDGGIMPAGYFAGFSYGQRATHKYETLAKIVQQESGDYLEKQIFKDE